MRTLHMALMATAAVAVLLPARAAVVVKIKPIANATTMSVFGINDHNVIVGGFRTKGGGEQAFRGPLNGAYKGFDLGKGGSEARAINNAGYILGIANTNKGDFSSEPMFEQLPNGNKLQIIRKGEPIFGLAQGISNTQNKFAGGYWDKTTDDFRAKGFVGSNGKWESPVYVSAPTQALTAYGINSSDVIVGHYLSGGEHGFIRHGKKWSQIDYPSDANTGTLLTAINDRGKAVGQWFDPKGHAHSFLLDISANSFTDIKITGAKRVEAWGINSAGAVVVNTDVGSYVWCETQKACPAGKVVDAPVHFVPTGTGRHAF